MSINIKEIFKSDLDPNSANWWAKDKVDKLNFNFGQLSNGGMLGISGSQGTSASTGSIGIKGEVGHQGETGFEGFEGAPVISLWKTNIDGNQSTIFPTGMLTVPDYGPTRLIIGKANDGSVNSDYIIDQQWTGTLASSAILYSNVDRSNFALDHYNNAGVLDSSFAHHKYFNNTLRVGTPGAPLIIQVNLGDTIHQLTTSENGAPNNQTGNSLTQQVSSPPNIKITDSLFQVNTETNFDVGFTSTKDFSYNKAATDKSVLISSSTNGDVIWKSKYEIFGALPVGSIMSIQASDFNNTNFHQVDTLYIETGDGLLRNIYGRGRVDTPFEGWYLCNGQDWQLNDTISNEVPNLNSFNFDIEADGDAQTAINNGGDNTPIIIGGASIAVDANYVTGLTYTDPGTYEITTPGINTNDISTNFAVAPNTIGGQTSSGYGITRMVHLINLGSSSLKWLASNTNNQISTENITLSVVGNTAGASCSNTDQVYTWDGVGINWISGNMSGITLYSGNSIATAGWYEKDSTSRYWSGTTFTQLQICPTAMGYTLYYSDNVRGLNWSTPPTSGSGQYIIETGTSANLLKFATEIKNMNGTAASAGWYRAGTNNNQLSYYRVYWDGTSIGYRTISNYIFYAGKFTPASTYSPQACNSQSDQIDIYYIGKNDVPYSTYHLTNLYNNGNGNIILVNKNWDVNTNANVGEYDLEKISSQQAPGSSYPWRSLVDNASWAVIDTNKLNEPTVCM